MTRKQLTVEGMSCEHCKMNVERALSSFEGVNDVEVDLSDKSVSFSYDESSVDLASVKAAIEEKGYLETS